VQLPHLGFEPWLNLSQVARKAWGFGLYVPPYRRVQWPEFPEYLAVGRFESEAFDPEGWRNDYPNPAFVRMTRRDAFWAAKILMRFSAEQLLAMVATGQYSNPEHARYFHRVLRERQIRCGRFGINGLNPLDGFRVVDGKLMFDNLAERYEFAEAGSTRYRVSWHLFDNRAELLGEAIAPTETQAVHWSKLPDAEHLRLPETLLLVARIESLHPDYPRWTDPVLVYLRPQAAEYQVVGIERTAAAEYIGMD
jgi:hypothetical protein